MDAWIDRYDRMASVEIRIAKGLDNWASTCRENGELPTAERREAFEARKRARQFVAKADGSTEVND